MQEENKNKCHILPQKHVISLFVAIFYIYTDQVALLVSFNDVNSLLCM